eukprot:COSAG02_NODE_3219_length_7155_cov_4.534864_6_plen_852_part_00
MARKNGFGELADALEATHIVRPGLATQQDANETQRLHSAGSSAAKRLITTRSLQSLLNDVSQHSSSDTLVKRANHCVDALRSTGVQPDMHVFDLWMQIQNTVQGAENVYHSLLASGLPPTTFAMPFQHFVALILEQNTNEAERVAQMVREQVAESNSGSFYPTRQTFNLIIDALDPQSRQEFCNYRDSRPDENIPQQSDSENTVGSLTVYTTKQIADSVYEAHTLDRGEIAVKVVLACGQTDRTLPKEIRFLANLDQDRHHNIVQYFGHVQDPQFPGRFYVMMEKCDGTIDEYIGSMSDQDRRNVCLQLCNALTFMHRKNPPIVHRDLKPANVLMRDRVVKLCDFGQSAQVQEDKSLSQERQAHAGSQGWQPKERHSLGKNSTPTQWLKVDSFSFGCLVYFVLTEKHPFGERNQRDWNIEQNVVDVTGVGEEDRDLLLTLLHENPTHRLLVADCKHYFSNPVGGGSATGETEANFIRLSKIITKWASSALRQVAMRLWEQIHSNTPLLPWTVDKRNLLQRGDLTLNRTITNDVAVADRGTKILVRDIGDLLLQHYVKAPAPKRGFKCPVRVHSVDGHDTDHYVTQLDAAVPPASFSISPPVSRLVRLVSSNAVWNEGGRIIEQFPTFVAKVEMKSALSDEQICAEWELQSSSGEILCADISVERGDNRNDRIIIIKSVSNSTQLMDLLSRDEVQIFFPRSLPPDNIKDIKKPNAQQKLENGPEHFDVSIWNWVLTDTGRALAPRGSPLYEAVRKITDVRNKEFAHTNGTLSETVYADACSKLTQAFEAMCICGLLDQSVVDNFKEEIRRLDAVEIQFSVRDRAEAENSLHDVVTQRLESVETTFSAGLDEA